MTGFGLRMLPILMLWAASCKIQKPAGYFESGIDTLRVDTVRKAELPIRKGDVLHVTFYSDNPDATAIYNQVAGSNAGSPVSSMQEKASSSSAMGGQSIVGYKVDLNGNIRMHGLGLVHAEGLTCSALERHLTERITSLGVLSNPYCIVKYAGIQITVLGEVRAPGVHVTQQENINIMDALAMAGDIVNTGRKDELILIREDDGRRTYSRVDLTSQDIFRSPHLQLRQNDILVVQANTLQLNPLQAIRQQYVSMVVSVASILVLLLNIIINIGK